MLACQQQGQKKPCTRSCLFTTLPNPNRQTSQPAHSTSQPGGRSGKDLVQLHRDGQGHLECDPGGIVETMVSTHTGGQQVGQGRHCQCAHPAGGTTEPRVAKR